MIQIKDISHHGSRLNRAQEQVLAIEIKKLINELQLQAKVEVK